MIILFMGMQYSAPYPLLFFSVIMPCLERLIQYIMSKYTSFVKPFKVMRDTSLKLIEARRAGIAKEAKVQLHVHC